MKLELDPIADAAYFEICDADVETARELEPGIIADYDDKGRLVGIEVLAIRQCGTTNTESPAMLPLGAKPQALVTKDCT
ncbi:DUF2283 domain-containing protein [Thiorhodovibrio frisius]|uniref:DUF2283 domain-containing protein n=1 Tax=Thiorhodovibrio frisius TaxID=631362 RepID=H8Z1Y8_9GAMM|nr:DUF2283 domain-containing protein [Thiorhodovibrio frisius]EIC21513.1 Protein of unknown function (DUF2283) [Thiorhodovibrio frisius]WPL24097.1 hypothetical protein Thiofri_04309 [Thiorhodovibrio frisius]